MGWALSRIVCGVWAIALVWCGPARAQCPLEIIGSGKVASVPDGRTLRLTDGRAVRLSAIEVANEGGSAASSAKVALEALAGDRDVTLKAVTREIDRYGRIAAYPVPEGAQVPLQHTLLAQGQARVSPLAEAPCRPELLALEAHARQARLGLWADPQNGIQPADSTGLSARRGHFTVVEGKVLSVRSSGATIYMNFGRRWIEGFAVTIRKRDERAFAAAGLAPKSLEGRMVRVRGWIEQRGGPRIEAAQPGQIELADAN